MNNIIMSIGYVTILIIVVCLVTIVVDEINNKIKKYKYSKNTQIIKSGTCFFNHDKNLKIITKKDIKVKFKKRTVIEATIDDNRIWSYAWGMTKEYAKRDLEKEIINSITEYYENGCLQQYIINDYIEEVIEYKTEGE